MALELLQELVSVSDRAADISRVIRGQEELFQSLIEEKTTQYIEYDYKTVADVLIQATVEYHLTKKFPLLNGHIKGEERLSFVNKAGQEVPLDLNGSMDSIVTQLNTVLPPGQDGLALSLGTIIYEQRDYTTDATITVYEERLKGVGAMDTGGLGIWIDPIDGTNEYVGGIPTQPVNGIHEGGLQVAVVLIGVYDLVTGLPVMGVVNQPFCTRDNTGNWKGRVVWGVVKEEHRVAHVPKPHPSYERDQSLLCLTNLPTHQTHNKDWNIRYVKGCGYKLLCVVDGMVDALILSNPKSFKWDTCGPQAILAAIGGGVCSWAEFTEHNRVVPLLYHKPDDPAHQDSALWRNKGGAIAYRQLKTLDMLPVIADCNKT